MRRAHILVAGALLLLLAVVFTRLRTSPAPSSSGGQTAAERRYEAAVAQLRAEQARLARATDMLGARTNKQGTPPGADTRPSPPAQAHASQAAEFERLVRTRANMMADMFEHRFKLQPEQKEAFRQTLRAEYHEGSAPVEPDSQVHERRRRYLTAEQNAAYDRYLYDFQAHGVRMEIASALDFLERFLGLDSEQQSQVQARMEGDPQAVLNLWTVDPGSHADFQIRARLLMDRLQPALRPDQLVLLQNEFAMRTQELQELADLRRRWEELAPRKEAVLGR